MKETGFYVVYYVFNILHRLYKILRISYLGHSSRKPASGMRVGEGMSRRTWQGETKRVQGHRSVGRSGPGDQICVTVFMGYLYQETQVKHILKIRYFKYVYPMVWQLRTHENYLRKRRENM